VDAFATAGPRAPTKTAPAAGPTAPSPAARQRRGRRRGAPEEAPGLRWLGLAVTAAVLLAVPGSRAAGAQPSEKPGRSISVSPPADTAIQQRIEGILGALGGVEALDVQVRSGVVRIEGRAESLALREQATELAERVDGVVLVRNDIHVAAELRDRLGPTWGRLKGYLARSLGYLPVLGVALLAFGAFAAASSALGRWKLPFRRLGLSHLGATALRVSLRTLLLTAGIVMALDILGLAAFVGTVVGALGILGIIAGIAFRDVVANYLPGIMLGLNPPFRSGDRVLIGAHSGRVVRVTSRETVLVQDDGQHLRIPNVRLLQEPIVNFARHRERRLHLLLDLALTADLRRVRDVGRETLLSLSGILREPRPFMRVVTIEAEQVRVGFHAWTDQQTTNFYELESRARQAVKEALLAAGVPFPMREITVHQPAVVALGPLDDGESSGPEEALLDAHFRAEQAEPARDLLREGRRDAR
jgi:small-conductance mechanosensitive channel